MVAGKLSGQPFCFVFFKGESEGGVWIMDWIFFEERERERERMQMGMINNINGRGKRPFPSEERASLRGSWRE